MTDRDIVCRIVAEGKNPLGDDGGACAGSIAQADLAAKGPARKTAELVREVSRDVNRPSH